MNYQLRIIKTEPNPNFSKEMDKFNEDSRNNGYIGRKETVGIPQESFVKDVLVVELTEEQFKKVKAEAIKVFE